MQKKSSDPLLLSLPSTSIYWVTFQPQILYNCIQNITPTAVSSPCLQLLSLIHLRTNDLLSVREAYNYNTLSGKTVGPIFLYALSTRLKAYLNDMLFPLLMQF